MLSEKLKNVRVDHNLTQQELAELAKVPQSTISYIEQGKSPRTITLLKIAKALDVKISELLE